MWPKNNPVVGTKLGFLVVCSVLVTCRSSSLGLTSFSTTIADGWGGTDDNVRIHLSRGRYGQTCTTGVIYWGGFRNSWSSGTNEVYNADNQDFGNCNYFKANQMNVNFTILKDGTDGLKLTKMSLVIGGDFYIWQGEAEWDATHPPVTAVCKKGFCLKETDDYCSKNMGDGTGTAPDPDNCSQYYQCFGGVKLNTDPKKCLVYNGRITMYHVKRGKCVPESEWKKEDNRFCKKDISGVSIINTENKTIPYSSSVFEDDYTNYGPELAIDGNKTDGRYFKSKNEISPYYTLEVPLQNISGVTIINRVNRAIPLTEVRVGNKTIDGSLRLDHQISMNSLCGTYNGSANEDGVYEILCKSPIRGEVLTVQIVKEGRHTLIINEITINEITINITKETNTYTMMVIAISIAISTLLLGSVFIFKIAKCTKKNQQSVNEFSKVLRDFIQQQANNMYMIASNVRNVVPSIR